MTSFLAQHPGGAAPILKLAGADATTEFDAIHGEDAFKLKEDFVIGRLDMRETSAKPIIVPLRTKNIKAPDGRDVSISPKHWTNAILIQRVRESHNTYRFTFSFDDTNSCLWLPCGRHILIGVFLHDKDPSSFIIRPYTPVRPVSLSEDNGRFELVIKVYRPRNGIPGGEMSQYLEQLPLGLPVLIKGPEGHIHYLGDGVFDLQSQYVYAKHVNLIAGGTGITPMIQLIRKMCLNPSDKTQIRLIYSNNTIDDILCEKELNLLLDEMQGRFIYWHTLSDLSKVHCGSRN